jgi:hypothetical protein
MPARPEITGRRVAGCDAHQASPQARTPHGEADAFTIEEFCQRHRISLQFYYKLRQRGLTPREIRVGSCVLVSREAAEQWRREREAPTN